MYEFKFSVGDRVRWDDVEPSGKLIRKREGKVSRRYCEIPAMYSDMSHLYLELYSVKFDDGSIKNGILPHGLERVYG